MFKIGTNIIGIGNSGIEAVNRASLCDFTGARLITVSGNMEKSKAEFIYDSKNDFMSKAEKHYMSQTTTTIVAADCANPAEAALVCEICAISSMMKSLTIAVVHMPSSLDKSYAQAKEYVDELHCVCNGVVIMNDGYIDDFSNEFVSFLMAVSAGSDVNAVKRIASHEELCELFSQHNDIYFASVRTNVATDSHKYKSQCVSLRLENQLHIDVANNWIYIFSSNGEVPKSIMSEYVNAVDKKNISCMPTKKLCISDGDERLNMGEFLFAVLCAQ